MSKNKFSKIIATSVAAAVVTTVAAPVAGAVASSTGDYKDQTSISSWAKNATAYLTEKGIMQGSNGAFSPQKAITRGEVSKIMAVSLGLVDANVKLDVNVKTGFKDVDGQWFAPYIKLLLDYNKDILKGYSDGTFKPNQEIRRDELAKIIVTAKRLETNENVKVSFKDLNNNWASEQILTLASLGIAVGNGKGNYTPASSVTREEVAVFMHRLLERDIRVAPEKNPAVTEITPSGYVLSIMHQNDTHANVDNLPKTVTAINDYRENRPDALLLHAGDVFSGTLYFNTFEGQADLAIMKLMGYDAMTFGNHEFDLGSSPEGHQALVDFIKAANFPFISSNVDFSADKKFAGIFSDIESSNPENGKIYNGIVKEVNGEKIGIFALTTAETAGISSPGLVTFEDYLEEAEKAVKAFEAMGVDKIVALTHIGYDDNAEVDNDLMLAAKVEGIDVIVGGHSHTQLNEPVIITKDDQGQDKEPTVIVQAYQYNDYLGTLDVEFDENGVVIKAKGKLLPIKEYAANKEASKLLAPYKEKLEEVSKTPIGVTLEQKLESPRASDEGNTTGISVRNSETILGNIITDGMLSKAREYDKDIVLAMTNGGGIRASIPAGQVNVGDVITVLPFGNTLATLELTGSVLKEVFEFSLKEYPKENGGFLHVSGGKVEFDSSKPVGERVVNLYVKDTKGEFVLVEDKKSYKVATNAFTAKGGDSYDMLAKIYEAGKVTDLGLSDWENLRDHLISIKDNIPTKLEGRIVDVSKK